MAESMQGVRLSHALKDKTHLMARRQLSFRRRTNNRALAFIAILFVLTLASTAS
jgi:deferrochelatase/peroxidase EfeB